MGDEKDNKKLALQLIIGGLTPATIVAVILYGSSDPKAGATEAVRGIVSVFTNAGVWGIFTLLSLTATYIGLKAAWKTKQEQLNWLKEIELKNKEEIKENYEFINKLSSINQGMNNQLKKLEENEEDLMKMIDAMAVSSRCINTTEYLKQRKIS